MLGKIYDFHVIKLIIIEARIFNGPRVNSDIFDSDVIPADGFRDFQNWPESSTKYWTPFRNKTITAVFRMSMFDPIWYVGILIKTHLTS